MAPNQLQVFRLKRGSVRHAETDFLTVERPAATVTVEDVPGDAAQRSTTFHLVTLADGEGFFHRVFVFEANAFQGFRFQLDKRRHHHAANASNEQLTANADRQVNALLLQLGAVIYNH